MTLCEFSTVFAYGCSLFVMVRQSLLTKIGNVDVAQARKHCSRFWMLAEVAERYEG